MQAKLEITIRGRLALLLLHLAAGAAWLSADDNARVAASLLAAPVIIDLIATLLARPRLSAQVSPRRTIARAAFLETIHIRNDSRSAVLRDLRVREPRTHVLDAGGGHLPSLAPGEVVPARVAARSPRRGRLAQRTFVATAAWPLGLFQWRVTFGTPSEMLTEPARVLLPGDVIRALAAENRTDRTGTRPDAQEYWGLREYRFGEDARDVHARRSASLGVLVRKIHRGAPDDTCALIVDLRRPPGMPPTFGRRSLELHLSRAASLVDALRARGSVFHCALIGTTTERFAVESEHVSRAFLAALATATTVAWRALGENELDALVDAHSCFWMAAGGHEAGAPRGRLNLHLMTAEAS